MKRSTVAYHEAGHAVAALVLRVRFKYVSIQPDRELGSAGNVSLESSGLKKMFAGHEFAYKGVGRDHVENHVIVSLAGLTAQTPRPSVNPEPSRAPRPSDRGGNALPVLPGRASSTDLLSSLQARTDHLVHMHWARITALADKLLAEERGSWEDVQEVVLSRKVAESRATGGWLVA
jgi:hypothetical protein